MTPAQLPDAMIAALARFVPDKAALRFEGRDLSYGALAGRIARMAGSLTARGVVRGDRVAYLGFNQADEIVLQLALARLGAMLLPLNWRLAADELRFIVENAEPRLLLADDDHADMAARIGDAITCLGLGGSGAGPDLSAATDTADPAPRAPNLSPDDPLQLVYTSGTTGRPKGAVLSQRAVMAVAAMGAHMYGLRRDDHVLNVLPLFHVGGMNIHSLTALMGGATLTLHRGVDPHAMLDAMRDEGVTLTNLVPTILQALMSLPGWPDALRPSMRAISIGSTDVPPALSRAVLEAGLPLLQIYGCTETGPTAIYQTPEIMPRTIGAIGRAGLLCDVRLTGPDGQPVSAGETGEIEVRGPNCMSAYWRDPTATADTIRDGWVRTGDAARMDGDGNFWFADRLKHVVISGGENIYPAELARILTGHPGLREFTVVGRPDPKWGAVPVVVAVRADRNLSAQDILAAFDGQIARFKRPRDVVFVEALPRNVMGKVQVDQVERMVVLPGDRKNGVKVQD